MLSFDTDSTLTPSALAKAKADGVGVAMLYLKHLTAQVIVDCWNAGLAVGLIFESTAERALSGATAGAADAAAILRSLTALSADPRVGNVPRAVAVYLTADFDATQGQLGTISAYVSAARELLSGRIALGMYGNGLLLSALLDAGAIDYAWLAGGSGMAGTKAFAASNRWAIKQDVGDAAHLGLGLDIDSDTVAGAVAPWAWYKPEGAVPVVPQPAPTPTIVIPAAIDMQRALQAEGLYTGALDGIWGNGSGAALAAHYAKA